MRNIWKIFTTDIRRISNNVVAVVIVMGLSILPALYAWFNISPTGILMNRRLPAS